MSKALDVLEHIPNSPSLIDSLVQLIHDLTVQPIDGIEVSFRIMRDIGTISNGSSMDAENRIRFSAEKTGTPYIATKDIGYEESDVQYSNGVLYLLTLKTFELQKQIPS